MFHNSNSRLRTRSRTEYNPHHLLLKLTTTLNTRLPKSSTLNSTSAVNANFSIWYDGRVMTCGSGPLLRMAGYLAHWVQINFISIIVSDILLVTIKCLLIWNIVDANDLLVICVVHLGRFWQISLAC